MRKNNAKKIIPLLKEADKGDIALEDKLSLAKCREILNRNEKKYTDEEILLIRDWFYTLASVTYNEYYYNQEPTIVIATNEQNNEHEESHYLRAS